MKTLTSVSKAVGGVGWMPGDKLDYPEGGHGGAWEVSKHQEVR